MKRDKDFCVIYDDDQRKAVIEFGDALPPVFRPYRNLSASDMAFLFFDLATHRGIDLSEASFQVIGALKGELYRIVDASAWNDCRTNGCELTAFAPAVYCCEECRTIGEPEYEEQRAFWARVQAFQKEHPEATNQQAVDWVNRKAEGLADSAYLQNILLAPFGMSVKA